MSLCLQAPRSRKSYHVYPMKLELVEVKQDTVGLFMKGDTSSHQSGLCDVHKFKCEVKERMLLEKADRFKTAAIIAVKGIIYVLTIRACQFP